MAATTEGISTLIDQLFLVCGMLCKFMTCLPCLTQNSCRVLVLSYAISSSPAMLFDGGEALCYLDCCSICIMTIIICMYLISTVISFIWQAFYPLSCDLTRYTRKTAATQNGGKYICLDCQVAETKKGHTL